MSHRHAQRALRAVEHAAPRKKASSSSWLQESGCKSIDELGSLLAKLSEDEWNPIALLYLKN
jgi:hypothetical protein